MSPLTLWTEVSGVRSAGAFMFRLAFLQKNSTVIRGGERWVALPRDRWCKELGYSLTTLERVLARLRHRNLIVSEIHLVKNRTRLFVRLSDLAIRSYESLKTQADPVKMTGTGSSHFDGNPIVCPTDIGGKEKKNYKRSGVLSHAMKDSISEEGLTEEGEVCAESGVGTHEQVFPVEGEEAPPVAINCNDHVGASGGHMKASDAIRKALSKSSPKKQDTVADLESRWKHVMSSSYGMVMVHVTAKQKGQMGHFLRQCPKGMGSAAFSWILGHWIEFVKEVEVKAGLKVTPSQPDIGFILKHAGIGITLAANALRKPQEGSGEASGAFGYPHHPKGHNAVHGASGGLYGQGGEKPAKPKTITLPSAGTHIGGKTVSPVAATPSSGVEQKHVPSTKDTMPRTLDELLSIINAPKEGKP